MNEVVFWLCACVGMTNIIVESEISKKVKDFMESYSEDILARNDKRSHLPPSIQRIAAKAR